MAIPKDQDGGYWYNSNTVPDTHEDFFEESSISSSVSRDEARLPVGLPPVKESSDCAGSIMDNITIADGTPAPVVSPTSQLTKGVGRSLGSLGDKIHDWRPSATVRKWSQSGGGDRCTNCPRLEREVAQLSNRLQASYSRVNVPLPVSATVHAILQGLPYSLQPYTSLQEKQDLLQAALHTADSDTIVAVLVFLSTTLCRRLFLQELENYPAAVQCYVSHLKRRRKLVEVVELLSTLGRTEEAGIVRFRQCLQTTSHKSRISQLTQLVSQHFTEATCISEHYQRLIYDQMSLLEQQDILDIQDTRIGNSNATLRQYPRASGVYDRPLLTTIYYCGMYHWEPDQSASPRTLKYRFRLTDRQYLWAVVRGRARVKHFYMPDQLANLLQNKGGVLGALGGAFSAVSASLGGSAPLKAVLPMDRVVDALKQAGAPDAVLSAYLSMVEPRELRLKLSLLHSVRPAVVEAYIAMKDRDGLQRYMTTHLPPGSADYVKAEAAVKTGRWR